MQVQVIKPGANVRIPISIPFGVRTDTLGLILAKGENDNTRFMIDTHRQREPND